jgi:DNA-nicking Smr family endonuclease
MKVRTLAELRQIHQVMTQRAVQAAAARAAAEAARREAEERAQRERLLFERAVGPVQRLAPHGRAEPQRPRPRPVPQQRQADEQAVMQEALSDGFDVETLLHTDEHLSFRRPGIGPDVVRRLRQGHWSIQAEIDLHGLRTDEARAHLATFVREAHRQGLRCVRVVHGKGLARRARRPCSKGACTAGWCKRVKCWPSCRRGRPTVARVR